MQSLRRFAEHLPDILVIGFSVPLGRISFHSQKEKLQGRVRPDSVLRAMVGNQLIANDEIINFRQITKVRMHMNVPGIRRRCGRKSGKDFSNDQVFILIINRISDDHLAV